MPNLSLVLVGAAPLRGLAEDAGFTVAGEADDYERAKHVLEESGAGAIVHQGIPRTEIDPTLPMVVVASDEDLEDVVALGTFTIVPVDAPPTLLAAALATAAAYARAIRKALEDGAAAREELDTRKLVERAKGILMKRLGLSEEDAYKKLQKASQNENRKMRDVADSIVRTENILTENAPNRPRKRSAS